VLGGDCLQTHNILYIGGDRAAHRVRDASRQQNFGRKSRRRSTRSSPEMGLSLGMKLEGWPGDGPPKKA